MASLAVMVRPAMPSLPCPNPPAASPLFWPARFGCAPVFSPDTFSVFTIFGVCQGGKDGRSQVIDAPPALTSSSSNFSCGDFQPRVSRGRPLSSAATASNSG